ncbi:hypothetical protein [Dysgonomonas sp. 520]|uniref:hypothetical protein n=1 Tax=Dysgonomonas sp. 520 TaxID=2302931 RepID=UPI0013D4F8FC|nr:hypothetical protein [Dysgonomonas sp. 520]NDW08610.1 hypothetical protein [Dysgonomonas sp. 520]
MKKKLLFLLLFIACSVAYGQVGVNTESPQGVFHIDGRRNTNGNVNVADDVVVDTLGRIGVGTNKPQTKVDIRSSTAGGGFRLRDGTQSVGKVLISDANGNGSWGSPLDLTEGRLIVSDSISGNWSFPDNITATPLRLTPGKWLIFAGITTRNIPLTAGAVPHTGLHSWLHLRRDDTNAYLYHAAALPEPAPGYQAFVSVNFLLDVTSTMDVSVWASSNSSRTIHDTRVAVTDGYFYALRIQSF